MKRTAIGTLVLLLCGAAVIAGESAGEGPPRKELGTALLWHESIDLARSRARRENKLVLALHVSGEFDQPGLT